MILIYVRSTDWDIDVNESTQYNQRFIGLTFNPIMTFNMHNCAT